MDPEMPDMDPEMPDCLHAFIQNHLDDEEIRLINHQFSQQLVVNRQVLWTGMTRESAQQWADKHNLQTLTTAMGPLMDPANDSCPRRTKTLPAWTKYIHGASAIFAWKISRGDVLTVLTHPPPERFHPSGRTSFQLIEEPIVTGKLGNRPVAKINAVHPAVPTAIDFLYQIWPVDDKSVWLSKYGPPKKAEPWREVRQKNVDAILPVSQGTLSAGSKKKVAGGDKKQEPKAAVKKTGRLKSRQRLKHRVQQRHREEAKKLNREETQMMQKLNEELAQKRRDLMHSFGLRRKALEARQANELKECEKGEEPESQRIVKAKKNGCKGIAISSLAKKGADGPSQEPKQGLAKKGSDGPRQGPKQVNTENVTDSSLSVTEGGERSGDADNGSWSLSEAVLAVDANLDAYAASVLAYVASWNRSIWNGVKQRWTEDGKGPR